MASSTGSSLAPLDFQMAINVSPFDPADHLQSEEDILYFLEAALEGNDPAHIARL